jgi:hypothetical protein
MVVADAGLLENRRAPATTLEGWRSFISADPSELALLPREQWQALGERDRRDYDEARIAYHAELVVVTTSASTRPGATAPGSRASGSACTSSPPAPGTRPWAGVPGGSPGRQDDDPGQAIAETAIYPDVTWLTARSLRAHSTSHRAAS